MSAGSHSLVVVLEDRLLTLNALVGLLRRRNLPVRGVRVGPHASEGRWQLSATIECDPGAATRVALLCEKLVGVESARAHCCSLPSLTDEVPAR